MNVLLRKITIISDQTIQVLNENTTKNWMGKNVITESVTTDKATYEYWIEFHVDQGRFYYGEKKPVEIEGRNGVYKYQISTSHTKRGLDKSLEIISEIMDRTKKIYPNWEIKLYQIPDIKLYRQFDKD